MWRWVGWGNYRGHDGCSRGQQVERRGSRGAVAPSAYLQVCTRLESELMGGDGKGRYSTSATPVSPHLMGSDLMGPQPHTLDDTPPHHPLPQASLPAAALARAPYPPRSMCSPAAPTCSDAVALSAPSPERLAPPMPPPLTGEVKKDPKGVHPVEFTKVDPTAHPPQ